MFLISIQYWGS